MLDFREQTCAFALPGVFAGLEPAAPGDELIVQLQEFLVALLQQRGGAQAGLLTGLGLSLLMAHALDEALQLRRGVSLFVLPALLRLEEAGPLVGELDALIGQVRG